MATKEEKGNAIHSEIIFNRTAWLQRWKAVEEKKQWKKGK